MRYSESLTDPAERALYERYRDDPNLDELGNEVALARMKLAKYMESKPGDLDQRVLDNIAGFGETIAKIVEKRHKIQYGEQVTIRTKDFERLAERVLEVARKIYGDDERYQQFLIECRAIELAAHAGAG